MENDGRAQLVLWECDFATKDAEILDGGEVHDRSSDIVCLGARDGAEGRGGAALDFVRIEPEAIGAWALVIDRAVGKAGGKVWGSFKYCVDSDLWAEWRKFINIAVGNCFQCKIVHGIVTRSCPGESGLLNGQVQLPNCDFIIDVACEDGRSDEIDPVIILVHFESEGVCISQGAAVAGAVKDVHATIDDGTLGGGARAAHSNQVQLVIGQQGLTCGRRWFNRLDLKQSVLVIKNKFLPKIRSQRYKWRPIVSPSYSRYLLRDQWPDRRWRSQQRRLWWKVSFFCSWWLQARLGHHFIGHLSDTR